MKKSLLFLIGMLSVFYMNAQQDTLRTSPPLSGGTSTSTGSGISMNVEAFNAINILEFACQVGAGATGYEVWYNETAISGPPNIAAANGWVLHETGTTSGGNPQFIPLTTPLTIPQGETFGIFFRLIGSSVFYTSNPSPSTFSDANMSIDVGNLAGYAGVPPTPTLHPRGFTGQIVYELAVRAPNDAGIASLDSPSAFCPGTHNIITTVQNYGTTQIDSLTVNWTLDGVPQTPIFINQLIDTLNGVGSNSMQVTLGAHTFAANQTVDLVVWTSNPNGMQDTVNHNDTLIATLMPSISGNYTINALQATGGNNFASFTDFANVLNNFGICGPVVADVVSGSGPYVERVELNEIIGSSSVNTITINGNGNTLSYSATGTADRTTMLLDGTDYLTVDSLTIEATGGTYGWVLQLTNGADHNTFTNCHFETSTTSTSTFYSNVVMSGSLTAATTAGNSGSYNTFDNNTHIGGYYAFTMNGLSSALRDVGNSVTNSTFENFYLYGLYLKSQDEMVIMNNNISREDRTGSFYGIYMLTGIGGSTVMNNRIHDNSTSDPTSTSLAYPIYMSGATGSTGNESVLANNLIYNINNEGVIYGMYLLGAANNHWKIYHNTIVIDQPSATSTSATRGIWVSGAQADMEIKNNIIYVDRPSASPTFVYLTNGMPASSIDNNAYYSPSLASMDFGFSSSAIADFSGWQSEGYDINGVVANPQFVGAGNDFYRPTVGALKSIGTDVLSDVPEDIEGVARTTSPDPGVYQFSPLPCTGAYNYTVDTVYPGTAEISWTSVGAIAEWQVEWDTCGFVPGSAMGNLDSVVTTNQNYMLTGLPKGMCICVFVREKCPSGGYGDWTGPVEICVPIDYDIELVEYLSPIDRECGLDSNIVAVKVRNNGLQPATNFDLYADITGDVTASISTTYTGTILPGMEDSIVIGTFNFQQGGDIDIVAWSDWSLDSLPDNDYLDTTSFEISPAGPLQIFSSHTVICQPGDVLFYTEPDMSSPNLRWFDINNNLLGTGDSIIVPQIDSTFTIRLEADTSIGGTATFQAGPPDNNIGAGAIFAAASLSVQSMLVSVYDDITIVDAVIYPDGSGTLQVEIRELPSATVVHSFSVPVNQSSPGAPVLIPFNVQLPPGNYQFGANSAGSSVGLYRNSAGAVYPYGDPNYFEITGNTFNVAYYYYYYDITVQYGSCEREDGELTLPLGDLAVADFDFDEVSFTVNFFNTSQNADSVVWDFAGLGTAMGDTVSFQFPQTDSFDVCMIAYGGCGNDTVCKRVWAHNISVDKHSLASSLQIFPNPSEGKFTLRFNQQQASDVSIELLDLSGKSVWMEHHARYSGLYSKDFDRGDLASGVYMLRINNRDGIITRRVMISK